ncbi:winged helix-turn-helix domain-containing protein [Microbispora bryophytorum]|uniref:Tc1-like transposase DDE domain-containing protein n=1 Tax=Microbispora bryophytorum TaxID=1460882 RepID=A0A8H9GU10_9ACTN|nr:winged helix-turn-helix domain-containing protein [Microbispora bryophytorum]GGN99628.1 hypothetical protein GCM10011574_05490 [Microbispora bryophytorum]
MLIGRMFHLGYTVQEVWYLLRRNGWLCRRPARRAIERDEAAIEVGKKEVWSLVEDPRRPMAPGPSAGSTTGIGLVCPRPAWSTDRAGLGQPQPAPGAGIKTFAAEHADWLTVVQLPASAPDLNATEGIWSLLKRGALANLAAADLPQLVRVIKRALKKIQYRPHLIDGCLPPTGLAMRMGVDIMN